MKPWERNWENQSEAVSVKPWERNWSQTETEVDVTKIKASDFVGEQGFDNKPFEKLNNYIQKITEVKVNEDVDYSIKDAWEGFKNNLFKFEVRKSNEKPEGAQVLEDTAVEALDVGEQYAEATKKAVVNADVKDLGKGTKEVSKALGRATAEFTIGGVGKVVSMVGDLMYDETDITNMPKFEANKIKGGNFTAETYKKIGRYLQDLSDMAVQSDILKEDPEIFSGSFVENPSLTRLVSFGASAVPSLFTAGGLHKLGVPNKLNGMILAGLESSDVYGEAREAGKGKGAALGLFALSSAGTAYLETKGLDNLFDNKMKSLAGRMLTTMGSEGFTEYWQTVYQNAVKKYGYDATQDLFEGGFEALIGGIIGGGGAQVVNTSFDKFSKRADKYGVTQEEKMAILNAVSNETNAKSEQLNAMFQSNYDKSMKTLEEYINTNKDEAAVAQAVEKKQQLEKIYNDTYNELKNIMPEQEAKSNAALIRNSAFFYANEFGISPEEFVKKRGVKVVKSDYNQFSGKVATSTTEDMPIMQVTQRDINYARSHPEWAKNNAIITAIGQAGADINDDINTINKALKQYSIEENKFRKEKEDAQYNLWAKDLDEAKQERYAMMVENGVKPQDAYKAVTYVEDYIPFQTGVSEIDSSQLYQNLPQDLKNAVDFIYTSAPVYEVTGKEFPNDGTSLNKRVLQYFTDKFQNAIEVSDLGEVLLDARSIKDSTIHGLSSNKANAFAAVPYVLKNGKMFLSQEHYAGKNENRYVFVAPIKLKNEDYFCEVVVRQGIETQKGVEKLGKRRFYIHEVELIKKLSDDFTTFQQGSSSSSKSIISKQINDVKKNLQSQGGVQFQESLNIAVENAALDKVNPAYEGETINIDGVERTVYNSNGDRIAMSEPALRNFYKWFGDSKVVDEQGRPLVVYHGTNAEFDVFNKNMVSNYSAYSKNFYFTENKQRATDYGNKILSVYLKSDNLFDVELNLPTRADIEKINIILAKDGLKLEGDYGFDGMYMTGENFLNDLGVMTEQDYDYLLKEIGYDGIKSKDEFIVFNPNQIKSTSNRGTFNPNDDRIYWQGGEDQNLVMTHSSKSYNLDNILESGSLIAPSMAITNKNQDVLDDFGFGDIIFVRDPNKIDFKSDNIYDRDIYSPRMPQPMYKTKNGYNDVIDSYDYDHMQRLWESDPEKFKEKHYGMTFEEYFRNAEKVMFKGYTPSGKRKYVPYNAENIIKEMKKQGTVGGESWNYGLSSFLANFSSKQKSLKQLKERSSKLGRVEKEVYEELKNKYFKYETELMNFGKGSYKSYSYFSDIYPEILKALTPIRNNDYVLNQYLDMEKLNNEKPELLNEVKEYLQTAITMNRSYFEAKPMREVSLDEFSAVMVPTDLSEEQKAKLNQAGLEVVEYERGKASEALGKIKSNAFFQENANDPKGAYVNRIIHLFQNADASTLPHELAHFWKDTLKDAAKMSKRAAKMLEDVERWAEQEFNRKYSVQLKDGRYVVNNKQGLTVYDHNFRTEADAKEYAKEELFAQGNEAYLKEGVAPNNSLKQAFRNFLNWLKHIYNQARQLDIRLSPEIRQVYADILGGTEIDFFLNTDPDTFVENRIKLATETVNTLDEQIAEAQRMGVSVSEPDGRGLKHVWETAMIPLSTRLGRVSNKLKNRLRRYEFDITNSLNHYYDEARPFLQKWKTFSEMDTIAFDIALKNDYVKKQLEIVDKYGAREEWEKVRKLLLDIFDSAVKAGLDVNFRPDYFPRKVKDVQGFLSYLRGRPEWTKFEEALRDADPDHTFTAEEQADFINKYLRGFIKVDLMPYKYGSEKQRSIEIINNEMNKYYAPSMESLVSYIEGMNARIEASKFLGRDAENLDASVGGYLDYLINNKEIDPNKVDEVKEILKARFNQKGVGNKWIAGARNISYMYTMGGINSAITQIEDLSVSMYKAGIWNTLTTAFENKKIKRADLGLDKISAEFVDNPSRTARGVDKLFKLTGLDKIDSFGKETLVNAMVKKFKQMSEESLRQYIEPIMEQETTQTIQDIKNGEMSDNVLYLVFSELSDVQPISLSELPAFYNTSGNLRILYMLKSFMIKRIDIFRNECFDKLRSKSKEARIQGMQNLFRLALLMIFCGVSKDWLINMLYGRKMDIPEVVVNNALGLVGFSKFHAYQLRDKGAGEVIKDFLMPPMFAPYDDLLGDVVRISKGTRDLKDAESFKGIPLFGRFYYWHIGRGKEKMKKRNKSKLK